MVHTPQILNKTVYGITWRSSPNFTEIGQEIWKPRVEEHLWPSVKCHWVAFHEIHACSITL